VLGVSPPAQWKACVMGLMAYGSVSGETGFIETLRFLKKKKGFIETLRPCLEKVDLFTWRFGTISQSNLAQFPKEIGHKFPSNLV